MLQQLPITTEPLLVMVGPETKASLLDEWTWLIGTDKRALLVTACGDVFIEDVREGTIHFLDVTVSKLSLVAETPQAFQTLLAEPSFVETYLHPERVAMLRANGLVLKQNRIYSFRVPLSLGGEFGVDNIDMTDVDVHFSIAGQIECQIAAIPEGAPITDIKIGGMPKTKRWWKFW